MPRRTKIAVSNSVEPWKDRIFIHEHRVVAELRDTNLSDADLELLMKYLDVLLRQAWRQYWTYCLDLDLSCNCGITDFGVSVHIVQFLSNWPSCHRLKLYQTSIGDESLLALSNWVSSGHAFELHLSDLCGTVTSDAVLHLLKEIHRKGHYPYWSAKGFWVGLWLRLEHNGIEDVDALLSTAELEGIRAHVIDRKDIWSVRPGMAVRNGESWDPSVNLVLFRLQSRKPPKQHDNVNSRKALLTMLHGNPPSPNRNPNIEAHADPQPLSVDEYSLWVMEAREDEESGANLRNKDTFGEDAEYGWSFEENLAANERIAIETQMHLEAIRAQKQLASAADGNSSQFSNSYENESRSSRKSRVGLGDAKQEIEEEIQSVLAGCATLRRADFDGTIRQYLHAIRTKGGRSAVREAFQLIHETAVGKERSSIQKWPAYLLKILKHFLAILKEEALLAAAGSSPPTSFSSPSSLPPPGNFNRDNQEPTPSSLSLLQADFTDVTVTYQ